jgi:hypothetical protein
MTAIHGVLVLAEGAIDVEEIAPLPVTRQITVTCAAAAGILVGIPQT